MDKGLPTQDNDKPFAEAFRSSTTNSPAPAAEQSPADPLTLLQQALTALITSQTRAQMREQDRTDVERERLQAEKDRLKAENEHKAFEKARMKKWEDEEKDRQARLIKLKADSAERLRLSEEQTETEALSRDLNKKQSTVLQSLQKLDNSTDPEAYLLNFELSMAEGNFPADDWTTIFRKSVTGRSLEAIKIWMQSRSGCKYPVPGFQTAILETTGMHRS